jgi:peptidoglycan-associated lipoprotein
MVERAGTFRVEAYSQQQQAAELGQKAAEPLPKLGRSLPAGEVGSSEDRPRLVEVAGGPVPEEEALPFPSVKALGKKKERSAPPLSDVFFAFDSFLLSEEAQRVLQKNAEWLRSNPEAQIVIEGHCDERGTVEYNLALGERRAQSVKDYLVNLGISADRLFTISYGKERPFVLGHTEEAWAQNRRAHFLLR